ncbi:hypothetical protein ACWGJ9_08390 [Curtobacterium citreum]
MATYTPRLTDGTFTFKQHSEAAAGLLDQPTPRDPEDVLGVPADQRIGLHHQGSRDVDGDLVEVWSSGSGHYEVHVADEFIAFYRDSDLHRHGGPAVVTADGKEDWYENGHLVIAARPFDLVEERLPAGGTRYAGVRSIADRKPLEVARDVRDDLRDLQRIGFLPEGATIQVSTTTKSAKAVNVRIGGLAKGSVIEPDTLDRTPDGHRLHDHLIKVMNQYNQYETGRGSSKQRRFFYEEVHLVEE